ncbi:MAG: putative transport system permease protein, partial [Pseudomonadota bacterium]|nr:putative transport system permease protein [Pseudomonadota bacterium]
TGVFVIGISNPAQAAEIARHIDGEFRNSLAETLTETEKAFQLSFVAMTEAIVVAIEAVAYVVILIIMAVMANTMAMAARERSGEYATLKALGFAPVVVSWLIVAESLLLALIGGSIGITLTFPATASFGQALDNIFPVFNVTTATLWLQAGAALLVGVIAAIVPAIQAARVNIVNGLRAVG